MLNHPFDAAPVWYARLNGALYLAIILFGVFSEGFVNGQLMAGDAATTAHNILTSPGLGSSSSRKIEPVSDALSDA